MKAYKLTLGDIFPAYYFENMVTLWGGKWISLRYINCFSKPIASGGVVQSEEIDESAEVVFEKYKEDRYKVIILKEPKRGKSNGRT